MEKLLFIYHTAGWTLQPLSLKKISYIPFMAQTWTSHWPSNWFYLDLNDWFQGSFMPNFRFLVSILTYICNFVTQ